MPRGFGLRVSDSQLNIMNNHTSSVTNSNNTSSQKSVPAILSRKRKQNHDAENQIILPTVKELDDCLVLPCENYPQPPVPMGTSSTNNPQPPSSRIPLAPISNNRTTSQQQQQQKTSAKSSFPTNSRKPATRIPLQTISTSSSCTTSSFTNLPPNNPSSRTTQLECSGSSSPGSSNEEEDADDALAVYSTVSSKSREEPPAKRLKMRESWAEFREFITEPTPDHDRGEAPFPELTWANKQDMWELICKKEQGMYKRKTSQEIFQQHPALQSRMRAILFDWLIEVCEVYRLHRETFYLTIDFVDRYLSKTENIPKTRLQLIGVSCLFIASKIEEIYPPKLSEFSYVTDGACSEEEILQMELVILKGLQWGLSPMTPNAWMKLYMQVLHCDQTPFNENFVLPQYSGLNFSRVMQLLDLCTLDMGSLAFSYSVLAASALYHFHNPKIATAASGYTWSDLSSCVSWMSAFAFALREQQSSPLQPRSFHNVSADNQHNIQTHTVELTLLDRAQARLELINEESSRLSPVAMTQHCAAVVMTPSEDGNDVIYASTDAASFVDASGSSVFMSPPMSSNDQ